MLKRFVEVFRLGLSLSIPGGGTMLQLIADPELGAIVEKVANFGVPAILLAYFIYYSTKIYNHLASSILKQGDDQARAITAVVERFDKTLERHEAVVNNIVRVTNELTREITRSSAALQASIQNKGCGKEMFNAFIIIGFLPVPA